MAHEYTWRRWDDARDAFDAPPDPDWDDDRELVDHALRNPYESLMAESESDH